MKMQQAVDVHDIAPENIILAGFSQGAAIALAAALYSTRRLGGVAVFSGFLPRMRQPACDSNTCMPMLWCHGARDEAVPVSLAREDVKWLRNAGFGNLVVREYPQLGHAMASQPLLEADDCTALSSPLSDFRVWLEQFARGRSPRGETSWLSS